MLEPSKAREKTHRHATRLLDHEYPFFFIPEVNLDRITNHRRFMSMDDISNKIAVLYHCFAVYYFAVERNGALFDGVFLHSFKPDKRRQKGKTNIVGCRSIPDPSTYSQSQYSEVGSLTCLKSIRTVVLLSISVSQIKLWTYRRRSESDPASALSQMSRAQSLNE